MTRKIKSAELTSNDLGKQIEIPHTGDVEIIGQLMSLSFKRPEGNVLTTFTLHRGRGITTHSTQQVVIVHE